MRTVYEVLYYDPRAAGNAGDSTHIARFRSKSAAERFAAGQSCYGQPATAERVEVPARVADRWSYQG